MAQALANLDPTGTLSAAGAAVSLIGTVLRAVPAVKNAASAAKTHSEASKGPETLHRAQTSTAANAVGIDPEREKRAYETLNFVLRELGSRICSAGLVNEHALEQALTAATQHIEVNLFSGEANRLFASLAPKLADPILVNAVFTSIYFIGALTAELGRSLPNYKDSYQPLGPWIVQQLFRTAIGEDAFRENLTANLDAYKTLATTAGLLRPTDIGYSTFPGFPALSPTRYSSRSLRDVRNHKSIYEKLVKHFEKFGFPQPIALRQGDVGLIKDWRFLAGDSPSRDYEVEKADKNIGENFGRVLHWLICSADRLPPGQAVIAYYAQHIELIKWIGQRMGYSVLFGATDLDFSGAHTKLDKNCRAIMSTWVILMSSERALATRRASSANWAQNHMAVATNVPIMQPSQPQAFQERFPLEQAQLNAATVPFIVPVVQPQAPPLRFPQQQQPSQPWELPHHPSHTLTAASQAPETLPQSGSVPHFTSKDPTPNTQSQQPKTIDERLEDVARDFNQILIPQCEKLLQAPPTDPRNRLFEYRRLTDHIERGVIGWLDGFPIPEDHPARKRRKEMIVEAQQLLRSLDVANRPASASSTPSIASTPSVASHPSSAVFVPKTAATSANIAPAATKTFAPTPTASELSPGTSPSLQSNPMSPTSPPPYSPNSPPSTVSAGNSTTPAAYPFPAEKPIRRKAPPPPRKFISAKAIYDFEPEEDNDEELAIKEGDDIEIIEKTTALEEEGWCRARVKGSKKLGLVPLEYLEIEEKPPTLKPTAPASVTSAAPAPSPHQPHHELHGNDSQIYYGTTSVDQASGAASISSTMYEPNAQTSYPSVYPSSSYPAPYPNEPQMYMPNNQQPHHASKMGKKMEIAGLAVATAGAGAGIASYIQQSQSPDTEAAGDTAQQEQPTAENVIVNEPYDPNQFIQNNDTTSITQDTTTITTTPRLAPSATPPPVADVSAYNFSPFDPQSSLDEIDPGAGFSMQQTSVTETTESGSDDVVVQSDYTSYETSGASDDVSYDADY